MSDNETRKPDAGSSTDVTPATSPQAPDTRDPSAPPTGNSIPPPPSESILDLVAEAAFVAVATALLGSIPAALRVARAGGSFLGGWIVSASVVVPVLVLLIYLSHAAGRGYRMLTGQGAGRSTALGLALWAGLLSPLLMFFSAILKEKTNHRGLGGATFGVVALALAILMALVARRLVDAGRGLVERGASARTVAVGFAAIAVGPLLLLSLPLLGHTDAGPHAAAIAAALIDGLILAVATAVAVSFGLGEELRSRARRLGLPAAGAFVILGFGLLTMSQPLGLALRSGGGLAAALLGGLERWTDRDGDGSGALFGGADCDEGDPRRHPGATDVAGDGVDQDCDGIDGAPVAERDPGDEVAPAAAAVPVGTASPAPAVQVPATRPSIVLVTLDTVRADWTSAFGFKEPTTPRLEALAKRGTSFGAAFAPGSDTQRALIHLFSGRPLEETARDRREWPTLKDENITIAERLKDAGYLTAGVSSFQWISKERGFSQGFEQFVEVFEEEHPERGTTGPHAVRAARAFLEKTASDPKPVFLWVHLFDAHSEYRKKTGFDFGKGEKGAYLSEIGFVDKQLGDLVDAIDASPRAKSTAIIVHGSQGEAFDEHGSTGHGKDLHAEVLRVPLVISLPGDPGGRRVDTAAVSTADIPATIVALAQASVEGVTGSSLLSLARGEAPAKREPVYARTSRRFAVIDYPLKLIVHDRKGRDRTLLFDLAADPSEKRDLSEERSDDLNRLSALLKERFKLKPDSSAD